MLAARRSTVHRMGIALAASLAITALNAAPAAAESETPCPNDVLRQELNSTKLPDCRAYELVSPVFKDGGVISRIPAVGAVAVAGDGSRLIFGSLGAFAGTQSVPLNGVVGAMYQLTRTGAGWTASPLDPPASESPNLFFFDASEDLTRTLWELRNPLQSSEEADLYLRDAGGSFVEVGPLVPPAHGSGPPGGTNTHLPPRPVYVGASSDLSRVFISIQPGEDTTVFWPGDTTLGGSHSLYEYVGTGNARPELVGVDNAGKLLSRCGTELGGAGQSKHNAVSADGRNVYFTALKGGASGCPAIDELYARLNRTETVSISQPFAGESQCNECVPSATRQSAEFQGASTDGSKAYFTTSQELFPEQVTNNLYEYDFNNERGHKVVLVSRGAATPEVLGVARVSADGSHAYFVARGALTGPNREGRAPTPGGANMYVFERGPAYPSGRLAFVATLSNADEIDWGESDVRPVQVTPDGRFLAFTSAADLTPDDTSSVAQAFEYDAREESLVRVSVGQGGYNNNGNTNSDPATLQTPPHQLVDSPAAAASSLAISSDGATVVFESRNELTPLAHVAAAGGANSVYEYRSVGSIANGNVELISDGQDLSEQGKGVALLGISASGRDAFFQTVDPLIAADSNTGADIYDARVAGGFREPPTVAGCGGEACQGPPTAPSLLSAPASASVAGGENLIPPQPIPKPPTHAGKLAAALRRCRAKHNRRARATCERRAKRRYGSASRRSPRPRTASA